MDRKTFFKKTSQNATLLYLWAPAADFHFHNYICRYAPIWPVAAETASCLPGGTQNTVAAGNEGAIKFWRVYPQEHNYKEAL